MTQVSLDILRDPVRMFALLCWSGACMLTLILFILAVSAVENVSQTRDQLQALEQNELDSVFQARKSSAR